MLEILKNRYQVIRKLGSGGFGETFLAEDTHMPSSRRCVIKQLKPVDDDPQVYQLVKERFQREAVTLEHLGEGHRQIPRLYAYFEEAGQFYLVEEWIQGTTLIEKIEQQGTLTESSVREILIGILPVLDYVHSQHIVHRDIKPDNIILRDSDHQPVLIDFGAVKETMGTVMTTSGRSTRSIVIGTPGYMPSEQAIGRPLYASDLYSLGLTAIYLLTGKVPQDFKTDPATGEMLWQQQVPMLSPSLAMVLDKAIQSHPRDRYSSAREMLDALQGRTTAIPPTVPPTVVSPPYNPSPLPAPTVVEPSVKSSTSRSLSEWQKAIITGSVIGSFILGALFLYEHLRSQSEEQQASSPPSPTLTPEPTPTYTPPPNPTPTYTPPTPTLAPTTFFTPTPSPPSASITQDEARNLVQRWLEAKREVFASPYNRALASELLTGRAYECNIGRPNSSVDWLQNNGAYYVYGEQQIDSVKNFTANGNQATIDVEITEQRTLYNKNGKIDRNASKSGQSRLSYDLQFDNGQWKISYFELPNC